MQITKRHLSFLNEAAGVFAGNVQRETFWNNDSDLLALRYGEDRDCIRIFEMGSEVGFFAQMIKPSPYVSSVREEVRWFAGEMERQLLKNENKGGWLSCDINFLLNELYKNYSRLMSETDSGEIVHRCANIANFAMMIADRTREPWDRPDPE